MAEIGIFQMAMTIAGCILGAGYVSGQELWQYFGSFGAIGIAGLFISISMFCVTSIMLMRIALKTGSAAVDELIIEKDIPWLRALAGGIIVFVLFAASCVMCAGIGAIFNQLFGIPAFIGSLLSLVIAGIITYTGLRGVVTVFSVAVPILVLFTIVTCGCSLLTKNVPAISFVPAASSNPLLGNWLVSCINYIALNYFASIGIIAPLVFHVKNSSVIYKGTVIGTLLLFSVGLSILLAVCTETSVQASELPMLSLAQNVSPLTGYIYSVLLFFGMFGNLISSWFGMMNYINEKSGTARKHPGLSILVISVLIFCASLYGFSGLVGTLYPAFGYIGIVILIMTVIRYIRLRH